MEKHPIMLLVVEGSERDRRYEPITWHLARALHVEFTVTQVQRFDKAIEHLLNDRYDAVLLNGIAHNDPLRFESDHPPQTTLDFLKHCKLVGIDTPVIVLTGPSDTAQPETTLRLNEVLIQLGASDFIPIDELTSPLLERSIRHAIEQRKAERQIAQLLKRDPLTGLGNRMIFEEHAQLAIERAKRNNTSLAVVFLDLDRFKNINDTLGHHVGDMLLTLVGKRLEGCLRKSDVIARIGGDEFTILLDNVDTQAISILAHKILHEVSRPAELGTTRLELDASMGIALYPNHGDTVTDLMKKADMALHECKKRRSCTFKVFTDNLERRLQHNLSLESAIHRALEHHEFVLHYQPQIDMRSGDLIGVEALIRWPQADGSMWMPGDFIPHAVRNGLIVPISLWVLREACRQQRAWSRQGLDVCVSVNISPRHLRHADFEEQVIEIMDDFDTQPGGLELELTEEAFVEAGMTTSYALHSLRQRGVRIAIDDFGTGYSSMQYLKVLPIDRIKIDRGFISGTPDSPAISDPTITKAVIYLATGLGLEVMAEGIESEQQGQELIEQGCHLGQGYYYSRPIDSDHLRALLVDQSIH